MISSELRPSRRHNSRNARELHQAAAVRYLRQCHGFRSRRQAGHHIRAVTALGILPDTANEAFALF